MSAQLCKHYLRFLWKNIIKENPFIKLIHNLISRVLKNLTWFMWFKSSSIITTKWRSQRCWYFKSILGFCLQGNLGKEKINLKSFCFRNLSLKKSSNRTTSYLYHLTFVNFQVGNWDTVQQKFFFGGLLEFHVNWDTVNFFSSSKSLAFPIYKGK